MDSKEIQKIRKFNYKNLCNYLIKKYGPVPGNYFVNDNMKTVNKKITRGNDGLFIHHIKENEAVQLNNPTTAQMFPFEYQFSNNLVYCNILEHLLLHYNIVKEFLTEEFVKRTKCIVGLGGIINHILPQINDYYLGYPYQKPWLQKVFQQIENNYNDYLDILYDVRQLITNPFYIDLISNKLPVKSHYDAIKFAFSPYNGIIEKNEKIKNDILNKFGTQVPQIINKSIPQVISLLKKANLRYDIYGNGTVCLQCVPKTNDLVLPNTIIFIDTINKSK